MTRSHRIGLRRPLLWTLALLASLSWASATSARPVSRETRQRILDNIAASKRARQGSGFAAFAKLERKGLSPRGTAKRRATKLRGATAGPAAVPDGFVVKGGRGQPDVLFDKGDRMLKRQLRSKAAKLRFDNTLGPWAKVERIQKLLRPLTHSGNEFDVKKNPSAYNKFNKRKSQARQPARLSEYWRLGQVVCREMACLTQVALEDAGFEARLVRGDIFKNGKLYAGHAWNEIKLDGQWKIVDSTNPIFNRLSPEVARTTGSLGGLIWKANRKDFRIEPGKALKARRKASSTKPRRKPAPKPAPKTKSHRAG